MNATFLNLLRERILAAVTAQIDEAVSLLENQFPRTEDEKDRVIAALTRQLDAAVSELNAKPMPVSTPKPMSDEVRAQLTLKDVVQRRLYCNKNGVWFLESRILFKEGKSSTWGLDSPEPVDYDFAQIHAKEQGIKLEADYHEPVEQDVAPKPIEAERTGVLRRIHSPYANKVIIQETDDRIQWVQVGPSFKGQSSARLHAKDKGWKLIN